MRWRATSTALLAGSLAFLAGCGDRLAGVGDNATRFLAAPLASLRAAAPGATPDNSGTEEVTRRPDGGASPVIADLKNRRSSLPAGSSYDAVARAALASSSRTAQAELQVARLRAQAAATNWLPRFGPTVSLTSLGDFVASIVVEQVLFDNGRKRAERDQARHEVEKAAVALVQDSNDRVHDALGLFLTMEEARARMTLAERSLDDMGHFEWVMQERVRGGISDLSDLNVIRQKLSAIRGNRDAARANLRAAEAELATMTGAPVTAEGGTRFDPAVATGVPLSVLMAEVERDITDAEARIARARHLPGLTASGTLSADGSSGALTGGSETLFGLGTGASLQAIEASRESATRRVAQAREHAARQIAALDQKIAGLDAQLADARALEDRTKTTLDLFQTQYRSGARQVMDVVGVYETWARQSETVLSKTYEVERLRIDRARAMGLLADGELM